MRLWLPILNAAVGGWTLRGGLQCAIDGKAGWAFTLGLLGALNLALTIVLLLRLSKARGVE